MHTKLKFRKLHKMNPEGGLARAHRFEKQPPVLCGRDAVPLQTGECESSGTKQAEQAWNWGNNKVRNFRVWIYLFQIQQCSSKCPPAESPASPDLLSPLRQAHLESVKGGSPAVCQHQLDEGKPATTASQHFLIESARILKCIKFILKLRMRRAWNAFSGLPATLLSMTL